MVPGAGRMPLNRYGMLRGDRFLQTFYFLFYDAPCIIWGSWAFQFRWSQEAASTSRKNKIPAPKGARSSFKFGSRSPNPSANTLKRNPKLSTFYLMKSKLFMISCNCAHDFCNLGLGVYFLSFPSLRELLKETLWWQFCNREHPGLVRPSSCASPRSLLSSTWLSNYHPALPLFQRMTLFPHRITRQNQLSSQIPLSPGRSSQNANQQVQQRWESNSNLQPQFKLPPGCRTRQSGLLRITWAEQWLCILWALVPQIKEAWWAFN